MVLYGLIRLGPGPGAPDADPRQPVGPGRTEGTNVLADLIRGGGLVSWFNWYVVDPGRTGTASCWTWSWVGLNWLELTGVVAGLAGVIYGNKFMLEEEKEEKRRGGRVKESL